ncbi:MAG: hypothetical protein IKS29_04985 [Oscillospiraceae bacterium]|nr:hypothetical protein [Oscillospiraceae bacterium]
MPVDKANQYKQQNEWKKKNSVSISLFLLRSTDADIIEHLDKQENKRGYIKSLIRADMERKKNETE